MTTQHFPYQLMPDLTEEEFQALKEDIKEKGVLVAVEFDGDGNVIDGHHRKRAWEELIDEGFDIPHYDQKVVQFPDEDAKKNYILSINLNRRHLTSEQKALLYARLRQPPYSMTLEQIGRVAGLTLKAVWATMDRHLPPEVEETMTQLQTIGKDGKSYPATYAPRMFERVIITREKAERDHTASAYVGSDQTAELERKFMVMIQVPTEEMQAEVLEYLAEAPWGDEVTVKAVMS